MQAYLVVLTHKQYRQQGTKHMDQIRSDHLLGTEERGLLVEGVASPGDEDAVRIPACQMGIQRNENFYKAQHLRGDEDGVATDGDGGGRIKDCQKPRSKIKQER